ncbi:hypothetical protein QTG54_011609 [Skeletonema marinoi]|uniref:Leucine-rich repeat domain-containing protein n=1 Tax=Skeletonema marinoi TaxID=267567 RepID=A0AAD8Y1S8_9STRA|nr:hypothetical protein QTG54_011609 [Skeletonema marinoi]
MNLVIVIGMFFDGDEGAFVKSEERGLDGMGAEMTRQARKRKTLQKVCLRANRKIGNFTWPSRGMKVVERIGDDEVIPRDATHVIVASIRVIPAQAFFGNPSIIEVICDVTVKEVGEGALKWCQSLRRVIMPGVEVIERGAFNCCVNLTDVECGKLEIIKDSAFTQCTSLGSISLPSAKIVEREAFFNCKALTDATFSSELERIEMGAFVNCRSLERIIIPLKDGIVTADDTFRGCDNLKQVDLVQGPVHETIAALLLEEWGNDMYEEIDSINQILPTAPGGVSYYEISHHDDGGKARAIRTWIRSVLRKIIHYKAEHQRIVDEAATYLQLALPRDIVIKNVLPFLELPSCTFEVELEEEDD